MDAALPWHIYSPRRVDRAEKHLHCHALLHSDRLAHAHPDLDTHTEHYTTSHLHSLPNPDPASHNNPNTHAYSAPHVDGISDADTASNAHPDIDSHTHSFPNTLRAIASKVGLK